MVSAVAVMASLQNVVKGDPFTLTPRLAWILSGYQAEAEGNHGDG